MNPNYLVRESSRKFAKVCRLHLRIGKNQYVNKFEFQRGLARIYGRISLAPFINAISAMVVEMRNKAHLTQKELAKRAKTTQPVIARLEGGKDSRVPSLALLMRVAVAAHAKLNLSFEYNQAVQR